MSIYIDDVVSGRPFGDARDGDATLSGTQSQTKDSGSASLASLSLTVGSGIFADGDLILIYQVRGTNAGKHEVNVVVSGGGTTSLILKKVTSYAYSSSGDNRCQVVKIPQYRNVTISGTLTAPAWDGDTGGLIVFASNNEVIVTGTIDIKGKGNRGGLAPINHTWGNGGRGENIDLYESTPQQVEATARTHIENGGGGGSKGDNTIFEGGGGGGGGHASAGEHGDETGWGDRGGEAGVAVGSADLVTAVFGGGGGGSGDNKDGANGRPGGNGGGGAFIWANTFDCSSASSIDTSGNNGGSAGSGFYSGGGGGAGGFFRGFFSKAIVGTSKIISQKGNGGAGNSISDGGDGSDGRNAIRYGQSITGSTNPASNETKDIKLIETGGSALFAML